ncbi:aldehyde dehydrogenase family protein [Hahella sp. KA22]|uniref:aldehyde dehydrogenase family protein n=1 Tax=Hahella sp. KA22 TaxID=1628392 RepID=UPI000FDD7193|nr:aldehyde dehydrogenase family protein [Hahella sp. KA22]AZZ91567.1 aldehyde dehydrogenase family protein [Hahella sp. KA22]QAY54937.1 aldehyde dehydrogenase family protein [Hahella sp. KA22]
MLAKSYPFYLANEPVADPRGWLPVEDKYTGEEFTKVGLADHDDIEKAIAAAEKAVAPMRRMPGYKRRDVLLHTVARLKERSEELAQALVREAGKPLKDSRGEVGRLIETFQIAAEEAVRNNGEWLDLAYSERSEGYQGIVRQFPIGVCSFITPFNFPLNLVAHKVAPAIAAGCPFVLKPASLTPIGALILAEILAETDLPKGAFSVVPCKKDDAMALISDERIKLLSFTGSPAAGWPMKAKAGKKKVVLELGGNAACIVEPETDLDKAIPRVLFGGYYQSGQSCVSVQRVLVQESLYEDFKRRLVAEVETLKTGDPKDENTFVGPLISRKEADRVASWINEAVEAGAELLIGGERSGNVITPTVLANTPRHCSAYNEEIFGPVTVLESYKTFDDALQAVNNSKFGLQTGVFTRDVENMQKAWEELEVGGVIIGDVPSWRVDHMPYGGVKDSGIGREGVRYAMQDMSEPRLLAIKRQS